MKELFLLASLATLAISTSKLRFPISKIDSSTLPKTDSHSLTQQYPIPLSIGLKPWLYYGEFSIGSNRDRVNILFTT